VAGLRGMSLEVLREQPDPPRIRREQRWKRYLPGAQSHGADYGPGEAVRRREGLRLHPPRSRPVRPRPLENAIQEQGFKALAEGDSVEFEIAHGHKSPRPVDVSENSTTDSVERTVPQLY
jgi:hypothetical protein